MANSEKLQKQVIQALTEKIPNSKCPLCGVQQWVVQLGTTYLPLEVQVGSGSSFSQRAISAALLICTNCGNSHVINLSVLLPDPVDKVSG
jgi:transcription elongation factor Elf1